MIYVPRGFAHGFQTLQPNAELIYHHSTEYTLGYEKGIMYNDEKINITWPEKVSVISVRDRGHDKLDDAFEGVKPLI